MLPYSMVALAGVPDTFAALAMAAAQTALFPNRQDA